MSFSYQFGANPQIDYPRFLVGDTQQYQADGTTRAYIWEDSEFIMAGQMSVFGIISPNGGTGQVATKNTASPFFIAANMLRSLASNRARIAGIAELLDVKLNMGQTVQALKDQACELENQERNSGAAAIVEQVQNQFQARERMTKQFWRLLTS